MALLRWSLFLVSTVKTATTCDVALRLLAAALPQQLDSVDGDRGDGNAPIAEVTAFARIKRIAESVSSMHRNRVLRASLGQQFWC
jgi:hypothetical protein